MSYPLLYVANNGSALARSRSTAVLSSVATEQSAGSYLTIS
jgi:hypothetical protein